MKTILVAGNPDMTHIKQEKCPHCGCEFTFDARIGGLGYGDVTYSTNSGIPYGDPYVVCPQEGCGKTVPFILPEITGQIHLLKKLLASLGGIL